MEELERDREDEVGDGERVRRAIVLPVLDRVPLFSISFSRKSFSFSFSLSSSSDISEISVK